MRKAIIFIVLWIACLTVFAQDTTYRKLPDARVDYPLWIINNAIITSSTSNSNSKWLDVNKIQNLMVYKDKDTPARIKNLGINGVISITTKQVIVTKTFAEIKDWLNIKGKVQYAVDGFFVDDTSLLIATCAIKEINVIPVTDKPDETIINIWTLLPKERKGFPAYFKSEHLILPGTVYIR
ncbi:hypothetical protein [Mucilaginibacter sp.]|uniref:hypothetical protein n=1 Tax=Mucilaginibacter sp. TaxID=1882438 RepID=UPI003D0E2D95